MDVEQRLKHIEEVSKNARTTWFSLIAALLFCGVTLLDVQDRDFFEYGAATKLPLIGVEVPVVGFFLSAPVLVLALYLYLHIYLTKLWRALAAPIEVEGDLDEHVYPWLLSDAALRMRPKAPKRDFGWLTGLVSWALGWAFAPVILFEFWRKSWPYHSEYLTLWIAFLLVVSLWMWSLSRSLMRDRMTGVDRRTLQGISGLVEFCRPFFAFAGVIIFGMISWEKTEGSLPKAWGKLTELHSANLYRLSFVQLPDNWQSRELAWQSYQRENRATVIDELERARSAREAHTKPETGAEGEEKTPEPIPEKDIIGKLKAEFKRVRAEAVIHLPKQDWEGVDLRRSELREAILPGLNLRWANMEGADLKQVQMAEADLAWAQVKGANLSGAQMEGAVFSGAQMQMADLRGAKMEAAVLMWTQLGKADLRGAHLRDANLWWAQLMGANLTKAQMQGAALEKARMENANLSRANLNGADLTGAQLTGADLSFAQLQEADFTGAKMEGADLFGARLTGSILMWAQLKKVNLLGLEMSGVDLRGANLEGANLLRTKLENADLRGAYLDGTYLLLANMKNADLRGQKLAGKTLLGVQMEGAKLNGANFSKAIMHKANLSGAQTKWTNFSGIDFSVINLSWEKVKEMPGGIVSKQRHLQLVRFVE